MQVASRNKITSVIHERSFSIAVQIYGPLRPTIRFIHNRCSYSIIKYISPYNNNFDVKGEQHRSFYMVLCNRPNNNNNNSHDNVYGDVIITKVRVAANPHCLSLSLHYHCSLSLHYRKKSSPSTNCAKEACHAPMHSVSHIDCTSSLTSTARYADDCLLHPYRSRSGTMSSTFAASSSVSASNCALHPLDNHTGKYWWHQLSVTTHTRLTALCPGLPGWVGIRKVKPIWILLKQETVSGSEIHWAICNCTLLQTDNHASTPPLSFLQAGCPSCRRTNSVKHWRGKKGKNRQTKNSTSLVTNPLEIGMRYGITGMGNRFQKAQSG